MNWASCVEGTQLILLIGCWMDSSTFCLIWLTHVHMLSKSSATERYSQSFWEWGVGHVHAFSCGVRGRLAEVSSLHHVGPRGRNSGVRLAGSRYLYLLSILTGPDMQSQPSSLVAFMLFSGRLSYSEGSALMAQCSWVLGVLLVSMKLSLLREGPEQ